MSSRFRIGIVSISVIGQDSVLYVNNNIELNYYHDNKLTTKGIDDKAKLTFDDFHDTPWLK